MLTYGTQNRTLSRGERYQHNGTRMLDNMANPAEYTLESPCPCTQWQRTPGDTPADFPFYIKVRPRSVRELPDPHSISGHLEAMWRGGMRNGEAKIIMDGKLRGQVIREYLAISTQGTLELKPPSDSAKLRALAELRGLNQRTGSAR